MKIYLDPNPGNRPDRADGGVRRVLDAQIKYLPQFGVKITNRLDQADLTVGHIDHLPVVKGKPFVTHCHGLYWNDYTWGEWARGVNRDVTQALVQAQAITAPSQWVAHAITRGLLRTPRVIYHGVEVEEWDVPTTPGDYVLWNKARADTISNPDDMQRVAKLLHGVQFVSTIGAPTANVKICGVVPYTKMRELVNGAGVYLATARETFGIGTLEALASGVPVAGWDYGGQSEVILDGETGYLAPYGDYNALADCIVKCINERARLSANARADAVARWQWLDKIEQYANLYKHVYRDWTEPRPRVSVIVPCHNLAAYLPHALDSLTRQTMSDFECIIVDDASTDNTAQIAQAYAGIDARFKYIETPENLKLSRTLNYGHAHARGRYVMNLDADNLLPERALEILADALDERRDMHIVYGALDTISDDGTNRKRNPFPGAFSWYAQMAHLNQLHSSAMMRREVIEQTGGYRERQWRAEDAELWCRASSFGFRIAQVTTEPTLIYRWRKDSKSALEARENADRDGDWCEYFPWRTARTGDEGHKQMQANPHAVANAHLVPFGAQGERRDKIFWDVYHRQEPLVSVVIPVGPGHERYLPDALDSLIGQTLGDWEVVVVNDTGEPWDKIAGAPYATVVQTSGKIGAGFARNVGLAHALAPLVFFLDADDMLKPDALLKFVHRYVQGDVGYVYSDVQLVEQGQSRTVAAPEYQQAAWLKKGLHSQGVLMATEHARQIRFDEVMIAWEDWDFFARCAIDGICGARIAEPLLIYRKDIGHRSGVGYEHSAELLRELQARYADYTTGAKEMGKCCGGAKDALDKIKASQAMTARVDTLDAPLKDGYTRMRYTGQFKAPVTFYAHGRPYAAASTPKWMFVDVLNEDVDKIKSTGQFIIVNVPKPVKPIDTPLPIQPAAPIETPVPVATTAPAQVISADMPEATAPATITNTPNETAQVQHADAMPKPKKGKRK